MTQALVLNATFEPLCVVSTRRALMLILDAKAELVHHTDGMFHATRGRASPNRPWSACGTS